MGTVSARLSIEVYVECPHCEDQIDLLDEKDTADYNHNEEGLILNQACPDGHWNDKHDDFEVNDVTCTNCRKNFNVNGLAW